jgi:hypothetical protein
LEDFLGKTMRFLNRLDSKNDLFKELESKFTKAMKLALQLIPLGGFRLPSVSGKRRPINMAFFESFSYLLSNLTGDEEQLKDKIKQVYRDLMEETQYIDTLTHSVDSGLQTDERYKIINKYIGKLNLC